MAALRSAREGLLQHISDDGLRASTGLLKLGQSDSNRLAKMGHSHLKVFEAVSIHNWPTPRCRQHTLEDCLGGTEECDEVLATGSTRAS